MDNNRFCWACGCEHEEGDLFCPSCGASLSESGLLQYKPDISGQVSLPDEPAVTPDEEADTESIFGAQNEVPQDAVQEPWTINIPVPPERPAPKKKKGKALWIVLGAIAALAVIGAGAFLFLKPSATISLNDYLKVECSGYDGYGTAYISVDWDAVEQNFGEKVSFTKAAHDEYGPFLELIRPLDLVRDSVTVSLDKTGGLSNGDTLAYAWNVSTDLSRYVNCNIVSENGSYTVSGLTEIGSFDPFDDLTVEFYGQEPDGYLEFTYNGDELSSYDFYADKYYDLSNGDTVTISIDENYMDYYAQTLGKVPSAMSREYTVSGLATPGTLPFDEWCGIDASLISTDEAGLYYCNAKPLLRIRPTPDKSGDKVGSIDLGDQVYIYGVYKGWGAVEHNGVKGWASMKYLVKDFNDVEF